MGGSAYPVAIVMPVLLFSDVFVWLLVLSIVAYGWHVRRNANLSASWSLVFQRRTAMIASVLITTALLITLLDSLHYRSSSVDEKTGKTFFSPVTLSVLDMALEPLRVNHERSYSAPLAYVGYSKESFQQDGKILRDYPRLQFGGAHLTQPEQQWSGDVSQRTLLGLLAGLFSCLVLWCCVPWVLAKRQGVTLVHYLKHLRISKFPVISAMVTISLLLVYACVIAALSTGYHVFGTDKVGVSVLLQALKSVRTAVVIGTLTTLITLPFALILGVLAGYFRGWVDELIQYIYTMLASIPSVLLISAVMLLYLVFIDKNAELFPTAIHRWDGRFVLLCIILGTTSFTSMCRLIRAETLKLRELEYVQAAQAFGISTAGILTRHIAPNLMHIVLISLALQFSGLVLGEAVLTYVGVGVDPSSYSFGIIINSARSELGANPMIWWTLLSAFCFMFTIVLATNLFADAVRDAFDPRARLKTS